MSTVDDIATLLAAEEHRQGRPYLADPDHCARCAEVDQAWELATCKHRHAVEMTRVEDPHRRWMCIHCSHVWFEEDE